jgi:3-hydroxy-9,10-secoandrosta-1,3,5(10)-triene-9,17-dione monooxygenase reductase component
MPHAPQSAPPARAVDGTALRRVCAHFATGVTVITTGPPEEPAGTTVNSFTSVSLEPPLVLFCLHRASRLRPLLQRTGSFAVNFLTRRQEKVAWAFAGRESAVFDDVAYRHAAGGVPVLSEALAFMGCRLVKEYDGGDHTILLGRVVELGVPEHAEEPLVFYRGAMRALEDEAMVGAPSAASNASRASSTRPR